MLRRLTAHCSGLLACGLIHNPRPRCCRRELPGVQEECHQVLQAKQGLVDAVKLGLGANTEQLRKVGGFGRQVG